MLEATSCSLLQELFHQRTSARHRFRRPSTSVRMSGGTRRITLSAVTLINKPPRARVASTRRRDAREFDANHQALATNLLIASQAAKLRARARLEGPQYGAQPDRLPRCGIVSTPGARGERVAAGWVVPWLLVEGVRGLRARPPRANGTPDPSPLARGITSGTMPAHRWANHLPVRPCRIVTSSIIMSQSRSHRTAYPGCRYLRVWD